MHDMTLFQITPFLNKGTARHGTARHGTEIGIDRGVACIYQKIQYDEVLYFKSPFLKWREREREREHRSVFPCLINGGRRGCFLPIHHNHNHDHRERSGCYCCCNCSWRVHFSWCDQPLLPFSCWSSSSNRIEQHKPEEEVESGEAYIRVIVNNLILDNPIKPIRC